MSFEIPKITGEKNTRKPYSNLPVDVTYLEDGWVFPQKPWATEETFIFSVYNSYISRAEDVSWFWEW